MILIVSAVSLVLGTALSGVLERFPAKREVIERCSGAMVVGSLVLIGGSLPLFR